nr:DUF6401 family natural product biosynthesis protein [Planosporangium flavigriseum]
MAQLRGQVGASGLSAMRADPALLAQVDQHVAAVRDALIEAGGRVSAVGLAAYADGVLDTAASHGWQMPSDLDGLEWSAACWVLVRLLAVCVVAETH